MSFISNLQLDQAKLKSLSKKYGSPAYFYDAQFIANQYKRLNESFLKLGTSLRSHYSVKASSSLGLLKYLKDMGASFDVVSGGEIERCLAVGATGENIVFSGVGKTKQEIELAISNEILQFNVESSSELELIEQTAKELGKKANVALRINPNIDALTHEYITTGTYDSKFGVSVEEAEFMYLKHQDNPHLNWTGLDMHIGSQLTEKKPIIQALRCFATFAKSLKDQGLHLQNLDIGGGLGINYKDDPVISPEDFAKLVTKELKVLNLKEHTLIMEPGRFIVAEAGVLTTEVIHIKRLNRKVYAIVDSGMTELMRPSLYSAYHEIVNLSAENRSPDLGSESVDVVGPICESSDYFAKDRNLPKVQQGDILLIKNCGAYASSMSHTYNTRPRAPEILVFDDKEVVLRRREEIKDLFALEKTE